MKLRIVARACLLAALCAMPLLQGCVGGAEDEIVMHTAWMPVGFVSPFGGSTAGANQGATGQTTGVSTTQTTGGGSMP